MVKAIVRKVTLIKTSRKRCFYIDELVILLYNHAKPRTMKNHDEFSLSQEKRIRSQAGCIFIGKKIFWAFMFGITAIVDFIFVLYKEVEYLPWVSIATLVLSFIFLYFVGSNIEKYRTKATRYLLNTTQEELVKHMKVLNRKNAFLKANPDILKNKQKIIYNESDPKREIFADISELEALIARLRKEEDYFNAKFKVQQRAFN